MRLPPPCGRDQPGYVYLVGGACQFAPVKVGHSRSLIKRLGSLQNGNPRELHVLAFFVGSVQNEQQLHKRLLPYRVRNEWFRRGPATELFMRAVRGEIDFAAGFLLDDVEISDRWPMNPGPCLRCYGCGVDDGRTCPRCRGTKYERKAGVSDAS